MDELSRGKSAFTWSDDEDCESGSNLESTKYNKNKKHRKNSASPKMNSDKTSKQPVASV